ncbi:MAG: hydrogenase nickel incorporation protein HypB [Desulfitobacteriia bacterium]
MTDKEISIVEDIYAENDRIAESIKEDLEKLGILAINVLGAPGAGKTSCLINIAQGLTEEKVYVVEGDVESDIDTIKLRELGIEAIQINTKGACHLDALLVKNSLSGLDLKEPGILFIENIGNLICPVEFQIGEHFRILVCSTAEGSDKPYKYPLAFEKADVILLTKIDLKTSVDFDDEFFYKGIRALNKEAPVFEVNAKTSEGFTEVVSWIREQGARIK